MKRLIHLFAILAALLTPGGSYSHSLTMVGVGSASSSIGPTAPPWVPFGVSASCHFDQSLNCWIAGTGLVPASSLLTESRINGTAYMADNTVNPGTLTPVSGASTLALDHLGLRAYQAQNLMFQSNTFSNGTWTKTSGATVVGAANSFPDPAGGSTATEVHFNAVSIFGSASYMTQTVTGLAIHSQYTCGAWIALHAGDTVGSDSIYLFAQSTDSNSNSLGRILIKPQDANYHYYSRSFTAEQTSVKIVFGTTSTGGVTGGPILGGNFDFAFSSCVPGNGTGAYVATTTTQITTTGPTDTITAAPGQALATALASARSVSITTTNGGQMSSGSPGVAAAALIDANGTTLIGVDAGNHGVMNMTSPLACAITGEWSLSETISASYIGTEGSITGAINCNGVATTDAGVSRSVTGPFVFGSTGGTSNFCNCTIVAIDVYPTLQTFPISTPPIASMTVDYGTGLNQETTVVADSFAIASTGSGVMYTVINDSSAGPGMYSASAGLTTLSAGTGTTLVPALISPTTNVSTTNFGRVSPGCCDNPNYKGVGVINIPDGAGNLLLYGMSHQLYAGAPSATGPVQAADQAEVIYSSDNGTTFAPLPGGAQVTFATAYSSPTFPTGVSPNQVFAAPGFFQMGVNYAGAVSATYPLASGGKDNSNNYLYAISNAGSSLGNSTSHLYSSWNNGDYELLARIPFCNGSNSILSTLPNGGAACSGYTSHAPVADAAQWQFYNANGAGCGQPDDPYRAACWGPISSVTPIIAPTFNGSALTGQIGMTQPYYDTYADQFVIVQWTYPDFNDWGTTGATWLSTIWTIYTSKHVQGPYTAKNNLQWGRSGGLQIVNPYYEPTIVPSTLTQNRVNLVASAQNGAYYLTVIPMLKNY